MTENSVDKFISHLFYLAGTGMVKGFNLIVSFFLSIAGTVKIIAFIMIVVSVGAIAYVLVEALNEFSKVRHIHLEDFFGFGHAGHKETVRSWQIVEDRMKSRDMGQAKRAILEADHLFQDSLMQLGYRGETFEDKLLLLSPERFPSLKNIKKVHAFSVGLSKTSGISISHDDAQKIIDVYKKAFQELGVFETL